MNATVKRSKIIMNAYKDADVGTVFHELDEPHVLISKDTNPDGTFNFYMEPLTLEEYECWKVLNI